ncbi:MULTISPECIES: peptidoglycan-binding protein [unclassified Fibrobacter]|uniref:CIS tube protein n=1 Tax=unclassified Fibrobacter TaxID=2634177 RepID=UPI000D6A9D06|nr:MULTISPECIES: peptidoglycan-binding protein [unclassified Fibrobacter]PWJ59126.1 hypothetical protein BGX12_1438 [Fibrobacter sp. UWR4]PZW63446.1 hypothetical protein C8E88_104514 [Fibrobacter sp. UWR1]
MKLTKLTLTACKLDKSPISSIPPFSVMVNPEAITTTREIKYTEPFFFDSLKHFISCGEDIFDVPKIILDTTGAIPKSDWPENCNDIPQMIKALKKVVADYVGSEHESPIVNVQWGNFLEYARLESMSVNYTLFNRSGKPLRAEITLKMHLYKTLRELLASLNKQSPDLTHLVEVQVGDSLPLMCERVYKDPSLYLQVAKVNNLTNFRNLKPGSKLYFPPIVD